MSCANLESRLVSVHKCDHMQAREDSNWDLWPCLAEPEATPPRAQPYFLTNKTAPPSPHLPSTDNPPTRKPPASLPSALPAIGCSHVSWSRAFLPAGWLLRSSVCLCGPMGIRAIQERVGYIPAGSSSSWGGGVLVHATHSVNQRTWRGKGNSPGPPTHNCLWTATTLCHYSLAAGLKNTDTHAYVFTHTSSSYLPFKDTFKAFALKNHHILCLHLSNPSP